MAPKIAAVMEIERVDPRRPFRFWWLHSLRYLAASPANIDWVLSALREEMGSLEDEDDSAGEGCWASRVEAWMGGLLVLLTGVSSASLQEHGETLRGMLAIVEQVGFSRAFHRR